MTKLTPEQYALLVQGIQENRVSRKQGQSHVEAWDIRRHLIRIFGFGGYDIETIRCDLVREIETKQGERSRWTIVYRAEVRLTVKAVDGSVLARYEDGATGDAINQPSIGDAHDFAMKTALSQALKRCAVNLGDQFGLALYNGGNPQAVVLRSLVAPAAPPAEVPLPVDDAPVQPEPGAEKTAEEAPSARPVSAPPAAEPRPGPTATGIRDWALASDRTPKAIRQALARLLHEHPDIAATRITNDAGDDEQLSVFLDRRAKELDPKPETVPDVDDRRRKRLFALFRDLGYDGPANQQQRRSIAGRVLGREVASMSEVTDPQDIEQIIRALEGQKRQHRQPTGAAA